jgi:hypothetical protein
MNNSVKKFITKLAKPIASFDFNDTFNTFKGKGLALQLVNQGFDIVIVSQLNENNRANVESIVKRSGIPVKKIYFTNGQDKYRTLASIAGIRRHYDNNQEQIDKINQYAPFIKGIKF